jgi:hypothetical protein
VYCSDCGGKLYFATREIWNKSHTQARYEGAYSCAAYRKSVQSRENRPCTCHYIRESVLKEIVLDNLRKVLGFAARFENDFAQMVMEKSHTKQQKEIAIHKKTLERSRARVAELDLLFERLYEDNVVGKLSNERFAKMSTKYEDEQQTLNAEIARLEADLSLEEAQAGNIDRFLLAVRRYTDIQELTPAIIHELIDKIIIYEPENKRKNRVQRIEIIYNGIGAIDTESLADMQKSA